MALQPRICGRARGGEDEWDAALVGRGAGGQSWQEHPVAALTAPAIAPTDGDRVGTVAGG